MGRKAQNSNENKDDCLRMFGASLAYNSLKPNTAAFDDAVVILSDDDDGEWKGSSHALIRHAVTVRRLLFGSMAGQDGEGANPKGPGPAPVV
eukprot:2618936-Rhodomonas_salina.1